ncbi:MAG: VOC family protein [Chloroflexi bacterium]|nr:VOC family protein [Chloroflexota bacterium]
MSSTKNSDSPNEGPIGALALIGIDVEDLDRSDRFWSAVLGLKEAERDGPYIFYEKQKGGPIIYLQKVPEKKTSKTRVHLDIDVTDVDVALKRVEALGGRKLAVVEESGLRWVVVADLDGNEFCLVPNPA